MQIWSLRLSVRTHGFHPWKRGSIPLGTAIMYYYVYILIHLNGKNNPTYVGITNNLQKRLTLHNTSKGAKFTRGRFWKIIYKKRYNSKSIAMKKEYMMKKNRVIRTRIKLKFLKTINNQWILLFYFLTRKITLKN